MDNKGSTLCLKKAYKLSVNLSEYIWQIIQFWSIFSRTIIGNQYMVALDTISVNLAKFVSSVNPADKLHLLDASFDLTTECMMWSDKARRRRLISNQEYQAIYDQLKTLQSEIRKSLTDN